ncbi:Sister chromatid cohesion 1 protein 4, partial [Ananas comosus]
RFGDGNASQIGLDLDEDLFLDKDKSSQHPSIELGFDDGIFHQGQSSHPSTDMVIDENLRITENRSNLSELTYDKSNSSHLEDLRRNNDASTWHGYNIQTPDLNEAFFPNNHEEGPPMEDIRSPDLLECAHAPSTPGLMEETMPANIQESPVLSPQQGKASSPSVNDDALKADNLVNSANDNVANPNAVIMDPEQVNNATATCNEGTDHLNDNGETKHSEITSVDGLSNLETSIAKSMVDAEVVNSPSTVPNNLPESGSMAGTIEKSQPSTNQGHMEEDGTLLPANATEFGSGLSLKSCTTGKDKASFVENVALVENASEFGNKEPEEGEDACITNATGTTIVGALQNSEHLEPSDLLSNEKPIEQSNSELPEPEKMLEAPSIDVNQTNELGQVTVEKGVTESDGSANRVSSLTGKKRRLVDSTPALENESTGKIARKPRAGKSMDYIPDDDDLLASILVGKKTPGLRLGPSPPPPKTGPQKRLWLTPRAGMPKRKVLVDDAMVLHADAIRQQLLNTEDIRHIRKKAPCTRPDIWMIEKSWLEDEIFHESIFSGASAELNTLQLRTYDIVTRGRSSQAELSKEPEVSDIVRTSNEDQPCAAPTTEITDQEANAGSRTDDATNHSEAMLADKANDIGMSEQQLSNELNPPSVDQSEMNDKPLHLLENSSPKDIIFTEDDGRGTISNEGASMSVVDTVNFPQDVCANLDNNVNGEASLTVESSGFPVADVSLPSDSANVMRDAISSPNVVVEGLEPTYSEAVEEMKDELGNKLHDENAADEVFDSKENLGEKMLGEDALADTGLPLQPTIEDENVTSAVGENSGLQENNLKGGMDVESTGPTLDQKSMDFCSGIDGVGTEFLNVDDEGDYDEEANDDLLNPEELHSFENSGWSSRTRGVARYLKTLFDEEAGRGRKSVAMDHLLSGKTREEASRMFFETLVLKTRDYIHVEQEHPFELINIKPRINLMKAKF